jgi:hypothetical protein
MTEQWLTFKEAIEIVRKHLGTSIGRSQAVTNAARASGEVRFHNPAMPVLLLTDDGIVGMDMRPGAQEKAGIATDGTPTLHRLTTTNRDCINKDDLLDWLNRSYPESKPKARRSGRPPAYDWDAIRQAAIDLMEHNGEFSVDDPEWNAQARLEDALVDQFGASTSALRERLPKFLNDWRKTKAGK